MDLLCEGVINIIWFYVHKSYYKNTLDEIKHSTLRIVLRLSLFNTYCSHLDDGNDNDCRFPLMMKILNNELEIEFI